MSLVVYLVLMGVIILVYNSIWRVPPLHQGALERLSKFVKKTYEPGFYFKIPFIDKVQTRECLIENLSILVSNVVPPEEFGELSFPMEAAGRVCALYSYLEHSDTKKELGDQFKQYIQDFVKDPVNPPKSWRDALKLSGEKYLHWIITKVDGKSFPKYEGDGKDACDGEGKGSLFEDDCVEKHTHTPEEQEKLKKGVYKLEKCMTAGEKKEKEKVVMEVKGLIKGSGNRILANIGFELTRLNVLTPKPSTELQKLIDDQAEQIQLAAKEELAKKVEEKQRTKEVFQTETIILQAKEYKQNFPNMDDKEIILRVLQVNKHLEGISKEIIINSLGKTSGLENLATTAISVIKEASK